MPPAARAGDLHACPSHKGGPVSAGSETVKIGGMPAARVGDRASCGAAQDTISQGSPTVFIEGRPAARAGDRCAHSGVIVAGLGSVNIGNDSYSGGSGSTKGVDAEQGGSPTPEFHGSPVSQAVLGSIVGLLRGPLGGLTGVSPEAQTALESEATALEVALARGDLQAMMVATKRVEELLKKKPAPPKDADASKGADAPPALGWQAAGKNLPEPVSAVAVSEGRLTVNGKAAGIHAISELDLIQVQNEGRIEAVVQRVASASAAGRNCARVFCMYANARGSLSPWATEGYWAAVDALIGRLRAYGMFADFVLFADCEPRADGTGGAMPGWSDRRAFASEAGRFFKGKPVIVTGMHDPIDNGATGADDPELVEAMRLFSDASGGTVPYAVGNPRCDVDADAAAFAAAQQSLASSGARILVAHSMPARGDDKRFRGWIDRLNDFLAALDRQALAGAPCLYYNQSATFGARQADASHENDPEAAVVAACVCSVNQIGFCYHRSAAEDPATPGLDLCRAATLIPQSPDFSVRLAGTDGSPISSFAAEDFAGGAIRSCTNGTESWTIAYAKRLPKSPRVEWRGTAPDVVWRGEHGILWHQRAD